MNTGELFTLEAEVAPQWIIESVESIPAGAIADWSRPTTSGGARNLRVLLSKPLSPEHAMWISVTARRQRAPLISSFGADDLAILRFPAAGEHERRIVGVQTSEAYQLQLRGAGELERLDPTKLTAEDAAVLPDAPGGLVFVANHAAQSLGISLVSRAAQFEAEIQARVTASDDRLAETYRMTVTPKGREIGRFNVRFSQPRSEEMAWSIEGATETAMSARRLSQAELRSTNISGGEVWEVTLPAPTAAPIVLLGKRTAPLTDEMPVALASIVEADSQRGTVEVRSTGRTLSEISSRLKSVPSEPQMNSEIRGAIAEFRYNPEEDVLLSADPPLSIGLRPSANKTAWIWNARLETRFNQSRTQHTLTCDAENMGRSQILISTPPDASDLKISVNNQPIAGAANNSGKVTIGLPAEARRDTIVISWCETESLGAMLAVHGPTWPDCDVPILNQSWSIWLPRGYRVIESQIGDAHPVGMPWAARLFWPFWQETASGQTVPGDDSKVMASANSGETRGEASNAANATLVADPLVRASWTDLEFQNVGETDTWIWIAREDRYLAWEWSLLLVAIGARWWVGKRGMVWDTAVIGFGASAVLLAPAVIGPLVGAAWIGIVFGYCIVRLWPRTKSEDNEGSVRERTKLGTRELSTAIGTVVVFVLLSRAAASGGDDATAGVEAQGLALRGQTWQVFFPVDEKEKPVGDVCYVPERFWDEIKNSDAMLMAPKLLIARAEYRDTPAESNPKPATGGVIQADFDIVSLVDDAGAILPLGIDGASLVPDGIRLDGQPATYRVKTGERCLRIDVPSAGNHRLEVLFRPTEVNHGFNFRVPQVNQSFFDLKSVGGEYAKLSLKTALGSKRLQTSSEIWLGPAEQVVSAAVNESIGADSAVGVGSLNVEQMDWLHIQPGSVKVLADLRVNAIAGRQQQMQLAIDPRWEVIEPAVASGFKVNQNQETGEVTLQWNKPIAGETRLELAFQLREASGVGRWEMPAITVIGARQSQRWGAISVDPALEYQLFNIADDARLTLEKIGAHWWSNQPATQVIWKIDEKVVPAEIATRPRIVPSTARYQMAIVAEAEDVLLRLSASVNGDMQFCYMVDVPKAVEIDRVSLADQTGDKACSWSRGLDGKLSIVPDAPIHGVGKILIVGRTQLANDGNFTVPAMRIDHCSSDAFSLLIARNHDALLKITEMAGMRAAPETEFEEAIADAQVVGLVGNPRDEAARSLEVLENSRDFRPVRLHIDRNESQIQVEQLTTMSRQAAAWNATIDASLSIDRGAADTLRFDLPANWVGPFAVSPAMEHSVEEVPGENRRQLVLRPEMPLSGRIQLQIRGPLTLTAGQTPMAPERVWWAP